jgi:hypothetical protein
MGAKSSLTLLLTLLGGLQELLNGCGVKELLTHPSLQ